jgi:hypothetical protein
MKTPVNPFIRRRALSATAIAGVLAVALSACGSSSTSPTSAAAAAGGTSSSARYEARLNYAKCMRAHGVNLPDPSANGGPPAGGGDNFRTLRNSPNWQSANQACAAYRAKAFAFRNITPAQRAQFEQALVKFAQCMRAHNIDIPDPSTSTGGGFGIFRQIPDSERQSPTFQTAFQACSSNIPFRRGGGGTGGPPPGAPGGPAGA